MYPCFMSVTMAHWRQNITVYKCGTYLLIINDLFFFYTLHNLSYYIVVFQYFVTFGCNCMLIATSKTILQHRIQRVIAAGQS